MKTMKLLQKKQQRTLGAIILIPLEDGFHTYGRILQGASYVFYDCRTKEDITDLNFIISSPVLFITAVYDNVIISGQWAKIGKLPLEEKFNILPPRFIQDAAANPYKLVDLVKFTLRLSPSNSEVFTPRLIVLVTSPFILMRIGFLRRLFFPSVKS
jgi:hypothetical protein